MDTGKLPGLSLHQLRADLYEKLSIGVYQTTKGGKILYANPALVRMLGYKSKNELLKINVGREGYSNSENREKFLESIEKHGEVKDWENEWLKKDSSVIIVSEFARVVKDEKGKTLYYEGIVEDITQRKNDEKELLYHKTQLEKRVEKRTQELMALKEKFHSILENVNDWIWEVDTKGRYTYSNSRVFDLLGYTADEIIGKTPFHFIAPSKRENVKQYFENLVKSKVSFHNYLNTNIHKNGKIVYIATSGLPFFDETGNLMGYRGIDRDITEQRLIEKALRTSERKLALHIRHSSMGYIEWDSHLEILDWNLSAERIFGYSKTEAITKNTFYRIFSNYSPENLEKIKQSFLGPYTDKYLRLENVKKNGEPLICTWFNSPLFDDNEKIIGTTSLVYEVNI
ncbi:MAG: PAS domain-containing protein [Lentimicrobiaceae bacterium]|nr:PAS domain-containing protein [Lentimicrobiaceae bacterium]